MPTSLIACFREARWHLLACRPASPIYYPLSDLFFQLSHRVVAVSRQGLSRSEFLVGPTVTSECSAICWSLIFAAVEQYCWEITRWCRRRTHPLLWRIWQSRIQQATREFSSSFKDSYLLFVCICHLWFWHAHQNPVDRCQSLSSRWSIPTFNWQHLCCFASLGIWVGTLASSSPTAPQVRWIPSRTFSWHQLRYRLLMQHLSILALVAVLQLWTALVRFLKLPSGHSINAFFHLNKAISRSDLLSESGRANSYLLNETDFD